MVPKTARTRRSESGATNPTNRLSTVASVSPVLPVASDQHQTDQTQQLDHTKSEFITLASHQLRTPISAISWLAELLVHGDAGQLTPQQREYAEQIYASSQRLANIVDDMLLITNIELGSLELSPQPTDIAGLSNLMLQVQLHTAPGKSLTISEQYESDIEPLVIDPIVIRTILRHLLSNAVKYTPSGGTITITLKRSAIQLLPGNSVTPNNHNSSDSSGNPNSPGSLELTIADTGYGIPQQAQQAVFTKMFRAKNIRSKDTDGTGLGLFIVKALLDMIGGKISFVSQEDKGSRFTVLLPVKAGLNTNVSSNADTSKDTHA